ncbi:MAG: serine--tRNA ligase [Parcubacteria group bacterium]|nr:serine--tRNA ligase [Parcubacteria group bacterium]
MLDIKFIREKSVKVKKSARGKGVNVDMNKLLELDAERRKLLHQSQDLRADSNKLSKKIGESKGKDKASIKKSTVIKGKMKKLEPKLKKVEQEFEELLLLVPNITSPDVKVGKDENDNNALKTVGKPKKFSFKVKDHQELGEALGVLDTVRATKVSGARFAYLKGGLAELQMALIQYVYDVVVKKEKFTPIIPPVIVRAEIASGSGHPEATSDEAYHLEKDDMYLVGTSEQSILPMYKDEVLDEKDLPIKYLGYSTCFRREAGSYGKDTQGILRQHQFDKLEMFVYCKAEDSEKLHKKLLELEEKLVKGLGLPYRVMMLCTGDTGYPSAKTYDIETWIPSQNKYRETHSTSNCTDFQARRLNIRYRNKKGEVRLLHTLNGTAFAIGRILIAIMENNQQKDGSIKVPTVLQKYCGIEKIG